MMEKHLHIMMGLPGSGKTTYVNGHASEDAYTVSLDECWYRKCDKREYAAKVVAEHMASLNQHEAWIDGLVLTREDIAYIVEMYIKHHNSMLYMHLNEPTLVHIHIHQYEENRNYCKNNDVNRIMENERDTDSQISIDNMKYEVLTEENIKDLEKLCIVENSKHAGDNITYIIDYELLPIKKCGNWDLFFKHPYKAFHDPKPHRDDVLLSATWSRGGSWGNYLGQHGSIEADEQPEFEELDNILLKVCPSLPILMYKKIYKDFVEVKETYENDYYGGTEYKGYYEADMRGIYNYLRENNLIEE